ncbi:MAG TPA: NAD(P)H-hydrate epimerase [Ardenticatenaceae bacterium]
MTLTTLTWAQMREVERRLTETHGVTLLQRIEVAGRALAQTARHLLAGHVEEKEIVVLAGTGPKGAAGLAAARHLHEEGAQVRVVLSSPSAALNEMAAHQYALLRDMGLDAWGLSLTQEQMAAQEPIRWTEAALLIDALLEPELERDPTGEPAELIRLINATRRPILSFDAPSGLSGDEGFILSPCIDAIATLTLALPKRGLIEGWPVVGELWLADLGVPPALYRSMGLEVADPFNGKIIVSLGPARMVGRGADDRRPTTDDR